MPQITWRAVGADWRSRGVGAAETIVALRAKRAKCTQAKQFVVSFVWLDMISDGRRHDTARFNAETAQRLDTQLMTASPCPARSAVPPMDFRPLRHLPSNLLRTGGDRALKSLKASMGVFGHHLFLTTDFC